MDLNINRRPQIVPPPVRDKWTQYGDGLLGQINSGSNVENRPAITAVASLGVLTLCSVGAAIETVVKQPRAIVDAVQARVSDALTRDNAW